MDTSVSPAAGPTPKKSTTERYVLFVTAGQAPVYVASPDEALVVAGLLLSGAPDDDPRFDPYSGGQSIPKDDVPQEDVDKFAKMMKEWENGETQVVLYERGDSLALYRPSTKTSDRIVTIDEADASKPEYWRGLFPGEPDAG